MPMDIDQMLLDDVFRPLKEIPQTQFNTAPNCLVQPVFSISKQYCNPNCKGFFTLYRQRWRRINSF